MKLRDRRCTQCGAPHDRQRARYCRSCADARNRESVRRADIARRERERGTERGRARVRAKNLKSKFGITVEQYDEMVAAQDGKCAICRKPPAESRVLYVDHCHTTGKLRGLLCQPCNSALGMFGDTVDGLQQAIAYLEGRRGY